MFSDNDFNERLLAFARNIAALLLVGGFALLILYRADTKDDLSLYQYWVLNFLGYTMLHWSAYLALSNVTVLYHDFRKYLIRCVECLDSTKLPPSDQQKSTLKLTQLLMSHSTLNVFLFTLRYLAICVIGFAFVMVYFIGILASLNQQAKILGFISG